MVYPKKKKEIYSNFKDIYSIVISLSSDGSSDLEDERTFDDNFHFVVIICHRLNVSDGFLVSPPPKRILRKLKVPF
jgi:hypothetical protein